MSEQEKGQREVTSDDASPEGEEKTDRAVTAVTYDGAFRVIALRCTQTVQGALDAQGLNLGDPKDAKTAAHFADLLAGTILIRLTMAPSLRVQGIVQGVGQRGTLVADAWPDGSTRGLTQLGGGATDIKLGKGAMIQMMRSMPHGRVHQSVTEMAEEEGVSEALMSYLLTSEQVTATLHVGHVFEDGKVVAAGGYVVQLLPEVTDPPLAVMTLRLETDFADRAKWMRELDRDPVHVMREILYGMRHEQTQDEELRFGCQCSHVRVLASLASLNRTEIEELARSREPLSIGCDYCGKQYTIAPRDLDGLLSKS